MLFLWGLNDIAKRPLLENIHEIVLTKQNGDICNNMASFKRNNRPFTTLPTVTLVVVVLGLERFNDLWYHSCLTGPKWDFRPRGTRGLTPCAEIRGSLPGRVYSSDVTRDGVTHKKDPTSLKKAYLESRAAGTVQTRYRVSGTKGNWTGRDFSQ